MTTLLLRSAIFILLATASVSRAAEVRLAAVFGDHMVLQRDKPVPVWGWAGPDSEVTVAFAGQSKSARSDADGKWTVTLDALTASAEPKILTARSGDQKAELKDVLVGEVWLGSGQSNMAMTVSRAKDFEKEKTAADLPLIRMFKEESPAAAAAQPDAKGSWSVCSPAAVGGFSATLFFFGRDIQRELGVPVGLINSSVGGTPIESWVAAEAQKNSPELTAAGKLDEKASAEAIQRYEVALKRWQQLAEKAKTEGKKAPRKPADPREQQKRRGGAGGLFNGKIAPLVPFAIRGAVWYQGEANSRPGKGALYQYQLPLLISDWRQRWGDDFPFAWVQLPNYNRTGEGWMLVREGMLKTLRLPMTGMAITTDIGDPKDIHPKNKQDVGHRLALWALGTVYGQKVAATSGPIPAGHETKSGKMVVTFQHADGLQAKGGELRGFVIAGSDQKWHPATARTDGVTVVVSSPEVASPVAVRYGWASNPDGNLFNGAGLPASPFRTDDWPVVDAPAP